MHCVAPPCSPRLIPTPCLKNKVVTESPSCDRVASRDVQEHVRVLEFVFFFLLCFFLVSGVCLFGELAGATE